MGFDKIFIFVMFFCFKSAIYVYHKYIALTILQVVTPIGNLVYHQYCVPTILQIVTHISLLKKVFLYRFTYEGLLSMLLYLICFFNIATWKHKLIVLIPSSLRVRMSALFTN